MQGRRRKSSSPAARPRASISSRSRGRVLALGEGDEILITALEHHANIVPWQLVCEQVGATLKDAPIDKRGELIFDRFEAQLSSRTKLVAAAHVSNALGTILPIKRIIDVAPKHGALALVDGAQAVPHARWTCRRSTPTSTRSPRTSSAAPPASVCSTAAQALLDAMPPWQGGGDMIRSVTFEKSTWNDLPWKFEAGTPNMSGAVGLAAAMDYVDHLGLAAIAAHEHALLEYPRLPS